MSEQYVGTVRGVFTKRQVVVADSYEQAEQMLKSNQGEDIEETLSGWSEVEDVELFKE